jgi:hypothetical protein
MLAFATEGAIKIFLAGCAFFLGQGGYALFTSIREEDDSNVKTALTEGESAACC